MVATPGRLLDLQQRGEVNLSAVRILVLDEADRMLDMGFWPDVRRILALLPSARQNMLFSATLSRDVMRIAGPTLTNPARWRSPQRHSGGGCHSDRLPRGRAPEDRPPRAPSREEKLDRVLVFTRTKHRADRVLPPPERRRSEGRPSTRNRTAGPAPAALDGFKKGTYGCWVHIVAAASSGQHLAYQLRPSTQPQDYVHRIGRTAGGASAPPHLLGSRTGRRAATDRAPARQTLRCRDLEGFAYMQRLVPDPERTAAKLKPRLVYNGSARRRR